MFTDCKDRRSAVTHCGAETTDDLSNKKKTVTSLRTLVDIDIETLPRGRVISLGGAEVRVERDGRGRILHRVYLTCGKYKVGWVLNGSTSKCLVCNVRFGAFLRKHHCRSCGTIMCNSCSKTKDLVVALDEVRKTRVCDICVSEKTLPPDSENVQPNQPSCVPEGDIAVVEEVSVVHEISHVVDERILPVLNPSSPASTCKAIVDTPDVNQETHEESSRNRNESSDISDVTEPLFFGNCIQEPLSNVSPTLIRRLAEIGFDGNNNSSDEEDTITSANGHSAGKVTSSFLSASGSSVGDESTRQFYMNSVSPLDCSVSPIRMRQPLMRTPRVSKHNLMEDMNVEQEESPDHVVQHKQVNRRRSIGEFFGLHQAPKGREERMESTTDDSEHNADVSASGSSVGDDSARRFFLGGDNSSIASINSLSPNGQDVVVHDTFHSPTFTVTPQKEQIGSSKTDRRKNEVDKENTNNVLITDAVNGLRKTLNYDERSRGALTTRV